VTNALITQVVQQSPGAGKAAGDTLLHGLDTLAAAATHLRDTLSSAPLPGGVATFVRFVFQIPSWIQITGAALAGIAGIVVLLMLWRRRLPVWTWLRTRNRHVKFGLSGAALFVVAVLFFGGMKSWTYMQHENAFCTGCHIMERPFQRFAAGAGKHEELKCHDCHQQSIWASTRQMVMWVADRPEKIGVHAPVPNTRCESCHQLPAGRKPFQHALFLAGHKVHFGSDSLPLRNLSCAKCHGAEIHRFVPSAGACQQSGCHENQKIRMAAMARLPEIKCTTCHAFTADLPGLASRDSAVRALVPSARQCLACHGMQDKPTGYIAEKDPHRGSCGSCHDVHKDSLPTDARVRCETCHTRLASSAFHNGANHKRIQKQCLVCHQPHAASVDASDCVACHTAVRKRGLFHPPLPFDTAAVLKRRIGAVAPGVLQEDDAALPDHRGKGDALWEDPPPRTPSTAHRNPTADSFPHRRHASLPCLTCHAVNSANRLVFEVPRGCDLCHHQSLMAGSVTAKDCARCHHDPQLARPRAMRVNVQLPGKAAVGRTVAFQHDVHRSEPCGTCHRAPNTVPPDSIRTCVACHDQHHEAQRNCVTCHVPASTATAHTRNTHTGCDACHTTARVAELIPGRSFCVTCHVAQRGHQPGRECSTCHFLVTPAQYRPRLMKANAG
jgi:hypothetical protein